MFLTQKQVSDSLSPSFGSLDLSSPRSRDKSPNSGDTSMSPKGPSGPRKEASNFSSPGSHRDMFSQLSNDNSLFEQKAYPLLKELSELNEDIAHALRLKGKIDINKAQEPLIKLVIQKSQEILDIYNICFDIRSLPQSDSLMEIEEISSTGFELAYCLKTLIPLICKFSHSFLKKIGLCRLFFCQDVHLFKSFDDKLVMGRLLNGIFPVMKLQTEESITNYFFKVLLYRLKQTEQDLDEKFSSMILPKTTILKPALFSWSKKQEKQTLKEKKVCFVEQARILKQFFLREDSISEKIDLSKLKEYFVNLGAVENLY